MRIKVSATPLGCVRVTLLNGNLEQVYWDITPDQAEELGDDLLKAAIAARPETEKKTITFWLKKIVAELNSELLKQRGDNE